jgi:hypothetical protein
VLLKGTGGWMATGRRAALVFSMILTPPKNKHSAVTNRAEPGMASWYTKYVPVVATLQ